MSSLKAGRSIWGKAYLLKGATLLIVLLGLSMSLSAQTPKDVDPWESWRFLMGNWVGEGGGSQPGQGGGTFSFSLDLQDRILVRRNRAEYPASKDQPASAHDDLMIIYLKPGQPARAIYFDNEGHVINYTAEFSSNKDTLAFISDLTPKMPRFRLTYIKAESNAVKITFEMASPDKPNEFYQYLLGMARRKK